MPPSRHASKCAPRISACSAIAGTRAPRRFSSSMPPVPLRCIDSVRPRARSNCCSPSATCAAIEWPCSRSAAAAPNSSCRRRARSCGPSVAWQDCPVAAALRWRRASRRRSRWPTRRVDRATRRCSFSSPTVAPTSRATDGPIAPWRNRSRWRRATLHSRGGLRRNRRRHGAARAATGGAGCRGDGCTVPAIAACALEGSRPRHPGRDPRLSGSVRSWVTGCSGTSTVATGRIVRWSRFVTVGRLRWHVQVSPGHGETALLVHGTGASTHSWRDLAQMLATAVSSHRHGPAGARVYRAAACRAALHCPSSRASCRLCSSTCGLEPQLAIGHSAGAAIAARMVLDGTLKPRAIVSLNGALLPLPGLPGTIFPPVAKLLAANSLAARMFRLACGGSRGRSTPGGQHGLDARQATDSRCTAGSSAAPRTWLARCR